MVKDIPVTEHSEKYMSYLLELNWLSPDNCRNEILESQQTSYKFTEDYVSEFVYNLIDVEVSGSEESNISANLNETTSSGQPKLNPQNILKTFRLKTLNRLIFVHLNINSTSTSTSIQFEINSHWLIGYYIQQEYCCFLNFRN